MSDEARPWKPRVRLLVPLAMLLVALPLSARGNPSALPVEALNARASVTVDTTAAAPITGGLDDALAAIESRIAALGERADRSAREAEELRAELDTRDLRVQELAEALEVAERERATAERQLEEANGVIRALRARITEIEQRIESLFTQLTGTAPPSDNRGEPAVRAPDRQEAVDSIGGLLDELGAQRIRHGTLITVPGEQLFGFDSRTIKQDARRLLSGVAELLTFYDNRKVVIIGHTDATGDPNYNEYLSFERAEAVKRFMVEDVGLDPAQIETIGAGQSRPIASNRTPAGRQANRRVEIVIHDAGLSAEVRADPEALGLP
jgi:outer membrane protein OmpA-like peptidoglycan-associated protein